MLHNRTALIRTFLYVLVWMGTLFMGQVGAQTEASLVAKLNSADSPLLKYEANIRLAQYWLRTDAPKAVPYAHEALAIAMTLKDRVKVVESALLSGELAEIQHKNAESTRYYTLAKDSLAAGQNDLALLTLDKLESLALARQDYKTAHTLIQERFAILQQKAKVASELEVQQQTEKLEKLVADKQKSKFLLPLSLLGTLLLALWYYFRRRRDRRTRGEMAEKNAMIEEKRRRSEQLLLNILPPAVAAELTVRNKVMARRYEHATVMFIDFVGFTKVAESMQPEELVNELDYCFSQFDAIVERARIEKIKTVGDAYICASGLTDRNEKPINMIRAAIAIQRFLHEYAQKRKAEGNKHFEARIGIHFGPVVAGVVGVKKFAYDIWGDTVNIAARLEEVCETGQINVSAAAMEIAKSEFDWEYRGKIAAKNKAEMDMYYVSEIK